jgi:integrase
VAKSHLQLIPPATEKRTVRPTRRPNADLRTREYLTEAEVERLLKASKGNRWALRDATMILLAYRRGLRATELTDLRWDQVDFATATLPGRSSRTKSVSRDYGAKYMIDRWGARRLHETICNISFPGLDLSRVKPLGVPKHTRGTKAT